MHLKVDSSSIASQRILESLGADGPGSLVNLPANTRIFESGALCRFYVILKTGSVRVFALDQNGGEIVLYRLGAGQTCVLNASALMSSQPYAAFAVTETPVIAWQISTAAFNELVAVSAHFRSFVFRSHGERIAALMSLVRELAFDRVDARLARCLLTLAGEGPDIYITHAALAVELGTAREVISRLLKSFERAQILKLKRGAIHLLDRARLRHHGTPETGTRSHQGRADDLLWTASS